MTYKIIRFFYNDRPAYTRRGMKGLTLEEARAHCSDPKSRKNGVWFEGYTEDKRKRR